MNLLTYTKMLDCFMILFSQLYFQQHLVYETVKCEVKTCSDMSDHTHLKQIHTAQKIKFFIKDFLCKCDQIHSFLRIWSNLLKKSLMENFIVVQCQRRIQKSAKHLRQRRFCEKSKLLTVNAFNYYFFKFLLNFMGK